MILNSKKQFKIIYISKVLDRMWLFYKVRWYENLSLHYCYTLAAFFAKLTENHFRFVFEYECRVLLVQHSSLIIRNHHVRLLWTLYFILEGQIYLVKKNELYENITSFISRLDIWGAVCTLWRVHSVTPVCVLYS